VLLLAPLFCCAGLRNYQSPWECLLSIGVISHPNHLVKRCENWSWFCSKTGTRAQATNALEINMCPSLFSLGIAVARPLGKWTWVQLSFCASSDVFPIWWRRLSVSFIVKFCSGCQVRGWRPWRAQFSVLSTIKGQRNSILTAKEVLPIQLIVWLLFLIWFQKSLQKDSKIRLK
jgi:hypothetical protein